MKTEPPLGTDKTITPNHSNPPAEDPESLASIKREMQHTTNNIRQYIAPYSKLITYICIVSFLIIVGFVGFTLGAYHICSSQLASFLDDRLACHTDYYPNATTKNATPEPGSLKLYYPKTWQQDLQD